MWLNLLSEEKKQKVFAEMRRVREKADMLMRQSKQLSPPNGQIPVGGAHICLMADSEGYSAFLRAIAKGMNPEEAAIKASEEFKFVRNNWNKKREYQVHLAIIEPSWITGLTNSFLDLSK